MQRRPSDRRETDRGADPPKYLQRRDRNAIRVVGHSIPGLALPNYHWPARRLLSDMRGLAVIVPRRQLAPGLDSAGCARRCDGGEAGGGRDWAARTRSLIARRAEVPQGSCEAPFLGVVGSEAVGRASHAEGTLLQHVGVDHRRAELAV